MRERSNATIARALREGFARAASAPALLIGTFAVARLLDVPSPHLTLFDTGVRAVIVWLLFWSFMYGGVIDRLARNRPTRAYGFFAACGGHLMPLARLALIAVAVESVLLPIGRVSSMTQAGRAAVAAVVMVAYAVLVFARIRLVVEDRRSAVGALAGSVRFLRRNPSGFVVVILFGLAAYALNGLYVFFGSSSALSSGLRVRVFDEAFLAIHFLLKMAAYASGIALFQSRLAHAGYTAAPPAVWPESASAEAIANAAPSTAQ
ncbi:MAG TPA: hypothetical protein VFZ98_00765 [Vicinamibacterales bacterium]